MLHKIAALAGMIGPVLFGGMLVILTVAEYDFMRSLRWHPLYAPTVDWPSGLALGPLGGWMIATFIIGGLLLMFFALSLWQLFPASFGPKLLCVAGLALMMLSFLTDPTFRSDPAVTWHGVLHDTAYILLGLSILPGFFLMAREFGRHPNWKKQSILTWLVLVLTIPTFIIKGITFYIFLLSVLAWYELIAIKIWRLKE
jgi:hypothetical protein